MTTPMQNFMEIQQRDPELLSSGRIRHPHVRGIESPMLDRVKIYQIYWAIQDALNVVSEIVSACNPPFSSFFLFSN